MLLLGGAVFPLLSADVSAVHPNLRNEYQLGPGDVLQIIVWKEADASVPSLIVRPDGRIALPFINELDAAGMTPEGLQKELVTRLSGFFNDPEVTVVLKEIHSKKIYLFGGVKKEGAVELRNAMTVLEAIGEVGGLTEYAKRKKIYVLHRENGALLRLPFDYDSVIRGEHVEQNVTLTAGDTVVVPH
jgi:polysaccharide export outer membrane protein